MAMMTKYARTKLSRLIVKLPEKAAQSLYEMAQKMFASQIPEQRPRCPYCGSEIVVKNGHKCHKQEFLCKNCRKTFVSTTNTLMANSHKPREVWEELIEDTLSGHSLDFTAQRLGLYHDCTFRMRHKFLTALDRLQNEQDVHLGEVSELDETFVLDSYKGAPLQDEVNREARKRGEKANKRGISSEYVCICAGVQRGGSVMAKTVNRAKPSAVEIQEVFNDHIAENTLILCDGLKSYNSLESIAGCNIHSVKGETKTGFYHLNNVNAFHSFIKSRYHLYRGVATKYLNRYNTLFAAAYKHAADHFCQIAETLLNVSRVNRFVSYHDLAREGLLCL